MSSLLCCMYLAHVERTCLWPQLDLLMSTERKRTDGPLPVSSGAELHDRQPSWTVSHQSHASHCRPEPMDVSASSVQQLPRSSAMDSRAPGSDLRLLLRHVDDFLFITTNLAEVCGGWLSGLSDTR
jgi:hypothetical protein